MSLQIKHWNKQSIVKQRARGCYCFHNAPRYAALHFPMLRWLMTRHITSEYAEAFKELCNSGTNGTSSSNKDRKDVNDTKEYLYSQCQDPFDLEDVPDHLTDITICQIASRDIDDSMKGIPVRGKVVFDDFVKQRLGDEPTKGFWDPIKKCTMSTFADICGNRPSKTTRIQS